MKPAKRSSNQGLGKIPMAEYCEGIIFQYFVPGKSGHFKQVGFDPLCRQVEDMILYRLRQVFQNRPDVLEKIGCLPNGLEVRIYKSDGWTDDPHGNAKNATSKDRMSTHHFVGRTSYEGDSLIMEFAANETIYGLNHSDDGFEVIIHEFIHLLDFFTDARGYLPGWSASQRARFRQARKAELQKIRQGQSPLNDYALVDNGEFLAVLAETFFEKPHALKISNPELYHLMSDFFRLDPIRS